MSLVFLAASSSEDDQTSPHHQTLYDILGAKPTDSPDILRMKYKNLAKKLHPDALIGRQQTNTTTTSNNHMDFRQVNAAWRVLNNPKEKLKYDRELQAKKFADNMELLLDVGIKNAVPFFQKTAQSTRAAAKSMGHAMERMELETRIRDMEKQAARDLARAMQMKTRLETIDGRRLDILALTNNNSTTTSQQLTSTEAFLILENFDVESKNPTNVFIDDLRNSEQRYNDKLSDYEQSLTTLQNAKLSVDQALQKEQEAIIRLQEAERQLTEAQESVKLSYLAEKNAVVKRKVAQNELEKVQHTLEKKQEKVKVSLRKKEEESIQRESEYLTQESARLEQEASELKRKAAELRTQAAEIRQKQR